METTLKEQVQSGEARPTLLRWQIALAFFAFILIGANDGAFGVILPSLRTYYGIDKGTAGLLFLASTVGYLVAAFSSGPLVAKLGPRRLLMLGSVTFLSGAGAFSLKPPFMLLLAVLLLLGFGVAILDAGLNAYIAGLERNTALLNYLHAFYGFGALLGPLLASAILAIQWDWNNIYFVWLGIALILLVGFGILMRGNAVNAEAEKTKNEGKLLGTTLKQRAVWLAAFFLLFYVGAEVSLGSWSYSFLTEERHEPTLLAGWVVSGYWLGLTLGRLVLGKVGERIGNRNLIQACLVGTVVGILLVWLVPVGAVTAFGLCLAGFSLGPIFPTTIALMPGLLPTRLLATGIGFLASLGSMGAALFPWVAGNLAQQFGLWTLLPYVIALTAIMLFFWWALAARRPANTEQ